MVSTSPPDGPPDGPPPPDGDPSVVEEVALRPSRDPVTDAVPSPARPGRYERSASGMVGALLVTLLVIGGYVAFRAVNRTDLDVQPDHVDYRTQVRYAQQAGSEVVYPARLPQGWYATQVSISPGTPPELQLSMLTPAGLYAGLVASPQPLAELLSTYVDPHARLGTPTTLDHSLTRRWQTWTDPGGDTALVAHVGHGNDTENLLVFGTASQAQLEQLASTLTTAPA